MPPCQGLQGYPRPSNFSGYPNADMVIGAFVYCLRDVYELCHCDFYGPEREKREREERRGEQEKRSPREDLHDELACWARGCQNTQKLFQMSNQIGSELGGGA